MKTNWKKLLTEATSKPGVLHEAYNAFYGYSIGNQFMAMTECLLRNIPAGPIATFPAWKKLGRHVKKGEKALTLWQPFTGRKEDDEGEVSTYTYFLLKSSWFTLSQTDGEDFEADPIPEWDRSIALDGLSITEEGFTMINGNCQGYASGNTIAINPMAALPHKTTFHEMAHVIMHRGENFVDCETISRETKEVEAESVAMICCDALGLEGAECSRGYIQNWNRSGEPIEETTARRIFSTANKILKAGRDA